MLQVFGRCIAGKGWGGNMGFFRGILLCALLGVVTSIATTAAVGGSGPGLGAQAGASGESSLGGE